MTADGTHARRQSRRTVEFYDTGLLEPMHDPIATGGGSEAAIDTDFDLSADGRYAACRALTRRSRWDVAANRRLGRAELPAPWTERTTWISRWPLGRRRGEQRSWNNLPCFGSTRTWGSPPSPQASASSPRGQVLRRRLGRRGCACRVRRRAVDPAARRHPRADRISDRRSGDTGAVGPGCACSSNLAVLPTSEVAAVIGAITGDIVQSALVASPSPPRCSMTGLCSCCWTAER